MESVMGRRLLLLDLDGTLVDTLPFLFDCFRLSVAPLVQRLPKDEEIVATFGPSEEKCIARLLRTWESQSLLNFPLKPQDVADSTARFHAAYEAGHAAGKVPLYSQIKNILEEYRSAGWALGVFTGKGRVSAVSTLAHHQLDLLMDVVITSDDVLHPKPAPDGVLQAIERTGSSPEKTFFVGDNPADIQAGNAAGVTTVAALWGAFNREETLAAKPRFVCESPSDLRLFLRQ